MTSQSSVRLTASREIGGSLCVTVDSRQVLLIRRAIIESRCHPVGIVKAVPLACGTRVRLLIALRPEFIPPVSAAIAQALETH